VRRLAGPNAPAAALSSADLSLLQIKSTDQASFDLQMLDYSAPIDERTAMSKEWSRVNRYFDLSMSVRCIVLQVYFVYNTSTASDLDCIVPLWARQCKEHCYVSRSQSDCAIHNSSQQHLLASTENINIFYSHIHPYIAPRHCAKLQCYRRYTGALLPDHIIPKVDHPCKLALHVA
jgi:hypothetical protein